MATTLKEGSKGKGWEVKDGVLVITQLDYKDPKNNPSQAFPRKKQ